MADEVTPDTAETAAKKTKPARKSAPRKASTPPARSTSTAVARRDKDGIPARDSGRYSRRGVSFVRVKVKQDTD